jgi:CheY-like chemotaxis protein
MTRVLIVDRSKSSLVMTSEVFKDKIPGVIVDIALSGVDCLKLVPIQSYQMIVVDFDLPDTDGVSLTHCLRPFYSGPILITAYPEALVSQAIGEELFAYHDSSLWVPKPIKFEALSQKIELFLLKKKRLIKRFKTKIPVMLAGKSLGRGKKTPKTKGTLLNLGLGGALFAGEKNVSHQLKVGDDLVIVMDELKLGKILGKVAWSDRKKNLAGLKFFHLEDEDRVILVDLFRGSQEIPLS